MANRTPETEGQGSFAPVVRYGRTLPNRWTMLRRELAWLGVKRLAGARFERAVALINTKGRWPRDIAREIAAMPK